LEKETQKREEISLKFVEIWVQQVKSFISMKFSPKALKALLKTTNTKKGLYLDSGSNFEKRGVSKSKNHVGSFEARIIAIR
jgi:hypothetical protein